MTAATALRAAIGEVDVVGPALLVPPGLLLAYLSSLGLAAGIATAGVGALGFYAVGLVGWARRHALPGVVALAALGLLAATVPAVPIAGLLAGASGVAVLLALGRSSAAPAHRGRAVLGLGLPFFGFLIAFVTAIVLPVTRQLVGVAALLAIVAVAGLAVLFARPDRTDAVEAET